MFSPAIRITLITAIATLILAALKLAFGYYGESHALFADGIHSLSDVLIDILVLLAAHFGSKKADYNHPYGHGRIETAGTFGLALVLIFAGIGIIFNGAEHLWNNVPTPKPEAITFWIALLAIIVNEILFRLTMKIAKKTDSPLLTANAWHSRSDVFTSIVVLLSIGGALIGFPALDVIGAAIVGVMIIKMGATLGFNSVSELVDTGVDEATLEQIKQHIVAVSGVKTLHQLRTRTINNRILVDVHVLVNPMISVSEGHFISDQVYLALHKKIPGVTDVIVHVDPEDDEIAQPSSHLPNREKLILALRQQWQLLASEEQLTIIFNKMTLHYLNGKLHIHLYLPQALSQQVEAFKQSAKNLDYVTDIDIFSEPRA